jgi:hypothetical protein
MNAAPPAEAADVPLLTDVIEAGLASIDAATAGPNETWRLSMLEARLPELFEQALLRVKPQLLAEFATLIRAELAPPPPPTEKTPP